MFSLNPKIVGAWDGNHVWIQWDDAAPEQGYGLRLSYWKPGATNWTKWVNIDIPWPIKTNWRKIPLHKAGWRVRAEVGVVEGNEVKEFFIAQAAKFLRNTATFEFHSMREVTFQEDRVFCATVDGEPCSYILRKRLYVPADGMERVVMEATLNSGLNQLDRVGDFRVQIEPGIEMFNVTESMNDLEAIDGNDVLVVATTPNGPGTIVLGEVLHPT